VDTEWSRTPRRQSSRRSTRSQSRHGPFAMALSPSHGVALSPLEHEKDEDLVAGCRCCSRSSGAAAHAVAAAAAATDTGRTVAPQNSGVEGGPVISRPVYRLLLRTVLGSNPINFPA
jgi:hypothetical protein